jgi:hypothetical protein
MDDLILFTGLVILGVVFFSWRYQKERREVRNKGINENTAISIARAGGYLLSRMLTYGLSLYMLAAIYYYVAFRDDCRDDLASRARYESETLLDHAAEAITWPIYLEDGPGCKEP